jgi:hypothetical protein
MQAEENSIGECLRPRDTRTPKEAYQIIQHMAQIEDRRISTSISADQVALL